MFFHGKLQALTPDTKTSGLGSCSAGAPFLTIQNILNFEAVTVRGK